MKTERVNNFFERVLLPIAGRIGSDRHLGALKDGFVYTIPLLIVGSFILLMVNLPLNDPSNFLYQEWYAWLMDAYKADLVQPYYVSMGAMSLFVVFGIGYSLAGSFRLSSFTGGMLSLFTFMVIGTQSDWIPLGGEVAKWGVPAGGYFPVLDARFIDAKGIFTAIISAFLAVHVYRFMVVNKITIRLPEGVPPAIANSFGALLPILALAILGQIINLIAQSYAGVPLPSVIMDIFKPLLYASNTYWGMLVIVLLVHLFWFCGLHGTNVIVAIVNPIILSNLALNQEAFAIGAPIPNILAGGFLDSWVYLGGAGATLGLAIAMSFAKNSQLRSIGRLSVIPGIFNINEPIIFGAPIILNPILGIPFILIPVINLTIAYAFASWGLIGHIVALVPWTTPSPLAAFIGTNLNWFGMILSILLIALSSLLYLPFVRIYEKSLS